MMQTQALLSHFVTQSLSCAALFDRDMRYLAASPSWIEDHGLTNDAIGKLHYELWSEIPEDWKEFHRRGLAGESISVERDAFARADGSVMWVRWDLLPWRHANGEIGGIVIITEDISAEETRRRSESDLRAMGDNLPRCAVYRYTRDADGNPRFPIFSAGVVHLIGVSAEAASADPNIIFAQIPPEFMPALVDAENVSRRELSDFAFDAPMRHPDGELRWIRWRSRPHRRRDGQVLWDGVLTDITEQVRQDAAAREAALRKTYLLEMGDALKPLRKAADIISAASERLGRQLAVHQVVYAEIDPDEEFATIRREWSEGTMPTSIGVHRLAHFGPDLIERLRQGHINAIEDVGAEARVDSPVAAATYRAREIGAFLSVPLVKDGKLVVVLSLHHRDPRPWSAFDVSIAQETAERTWAAIERCRAEEALRASEQRLRFALTAASAATWEWDPTTNSNVWSEELWRLYGLAPHSREPSFDAWLGSMHPDDRARAGDASLKAVAERRELEIEWRVGSPDGAERWLLSRGSPVHSRDDATPRYIGVVFDITERKRSEERINYLAHHDVLTDLPNRLAFGERLAAAIDKAARTGAPLAVVCIDLDRFKDVNDVFGHMVGDELLRQVARQLHAARDGAELARVGGDEFTLIVSGPHARTQALDIVERLRAAVAAPFEIGSRRIRIGLSVGVAFYPDQSDAQSLLASADAALYRAKAMGGGKTCLFDSALDNRHRERHALLQSLEAAIENNELSLNYQPQATANDEIFGFEALLRWRSPLHGMVPPNVFIPIAEECGLIKVIGEWALRRACQQAASWPRHLSVAVNLSPVQFLEDGLPGILHAILLETGLPGDRLELEITEGVLVSDFSRVSAILRQLKSLGVRVAMDDFGTGYSSLAYLQSFPFDKIKIDRSFVSNLQANPNAQAIIRGIIGLARGLNIPLIAEGVETREQLEFLRAEGCAEAQGYLIGKPLPIEAYAGIIGRTAGTATARRSS